MARFADIPLFPRAHYELDVEWKDLERQLAYWNRDFQLDLDPPFQRAHVWTREQQIAYVEYVLAGGEVARGLTFNSKGWDGPSDRVDIQLLDGKQRLEAVRAFLRGDIKAFGHYRSEYTDHMRMYVCFKFRVCSLASEAEVLRLYLNINAGGTPHTAEEIERVRAMLRAAEAAKKE